MKYQNNLLARPYMRAFLRDLEEFSQQLSTQQTAFLNCYRELIANSHTWRALQSDWRDFLAEALSDNALGLLFSLPNERIAELLSEYQQQLQQRGLKSTTRNRRITSLRNLFRMAERQGWRTEKISHWINPEIAEVKARPRIESAVIDRLLQMPLESTLQGCRDAVLLRLLIENGLSRTQLCALDIGDFSAGSDTHSTENHSTTNRSIPNHSTEALSGDEARDGPALRVWKLRRRRAARDPTGTFFTESAENSRVQEKVALSPECAQKMGQYLRLLETQNAEVAASSPLFRALDRRQLNNCLQNPRLTDDGVYAIVLRYAKLLDAPLTPRALQGLRPFS